MRKNGYHKEEAPMSSLLNKNQRMNHPRAQVQSLRKIAQIALRKGNDARAQQAIAEMKALNEEHNLGYPV